jgi:DNA polymerase-1
MRLGYFHLHEGAFLLAKTLLLVDGSSYLYRAFHALPDLRNKDGFPTGAIYGVIAMLKRLRKDIPAECAACVFDAKGKTFRDDWYPAYKAQRPPMPDDLAQQIEPLHDAIRALGWPLLMVPGVEADDVIATLVKQAEREGMQSVVSTGDKDLAQLVGPATRLMNTMTNEVLDEAGVLAKFGVPAERIVDYLTLIGDAVDNVPGVAKVGPKTAVKWLAEFGDLDTLVQRAGEIKGVVGDNLRASLDWLPMARRLLTVKTDVELAVDAAALHWQAEDTAQLSALYATYNFRTWLGELGQPAATATATETDPPPPRPERNYQCLLTEADLQTWIDKLTRAELICLDTETTSLDTMQARLVGLSFSVIDAQPTEPHQAQFELGLEPAPPAAAEAAYLPVGHRYAGAPDQLPLDTVLARLRPILEDPQRPKVGQNLKYDWHVLQNHGIDLRGIAHDTLLQSYVLEAHERHDMDDLAARHLHETTIKYEEVCGKGAAQIGFDQVDIARATDYAAEDADITLRLHQALYPKVRREAGLDRLRLQRNRNARCCPSWRASNAPACCSIPTCCAQAIPLPGRRNARPGAKAHALAGQPFNLNSPKQLGEILFEPAASCRWSRKPPRARHRPTKRCWKSSPRTTRIAEAILEYRGLAKLNRPTPTNCRTWSTPPRDGCTPTTARRWRSPAGCRRAIPTCRTSRCAREEGRRIREAFIAAPGHKSSSRPTIRRSSCASWRTCRATSACSRPSADGEDIHRATAAEVFRRGAGGDVSRAAAHGQGHQLRPDLRHVGVRPGARNWASTGARPRTTSTAISRAIPAWPTTWRAPARRPSMDGYVETLFGRRLYLPEIHSPATRAGARAPSAPPSMRPCRAPLPT